MAGTGVDQVVAIPTGGGGPSAGSGSTMARISGWWHRLPTWGKVVAVIVVIGLIVLVWLFVGGVAGSSNGGSAASLGGSGGAGGGGGGFGSPPSNSTQPPQQLPSGPGGTDQPSPVQSTQPTTTTTTTFPSTIVPTGKLPAADLHPYTPTTTAHGTTGTSTPVQHSEPVVSSTPAHANSGSFTTQPYYVTPSYPQNAGQVKPTPAYQKAYGNKVGYSPGIRSITPQMGGGQANSAAVALNNAFKNWQKSHPGGTSAQFSAALTGAAQAQAHNSASQVKPTAAYTQKTGLHSYAPQIRGGHTPGMGSSATAPHPKSNTGGMTTYDRATPYSVKRSAPAPASKSTTATLGHAGLRGF